MITRVIVPVREPIRIVFPEPPIVQVAPRATRIEIAAVDTLVNELAWTITNPAGYPLVVIGT